MAKKSRRAGAHQVAPETPEDVRAWARELLSVIGKRAARTVLNDYMAIAHDEKVTKDGRQIAARRARILKEFLSRHH